MADHPRNVPDDVLKLVKANNGVVMVNFYPAYLTEAANSVGAQLVGAMPGPGGLHAGPMLTQGMQALLLLNVEPELDAADPPAASQSRASRTRQSS